MLRIPTSAGGRPSANGGQDLRVGARGRVGTMEEGDDDKFDGNDGNNLTVPLMSQMHGACNGGTTLCVRWRCCSKGASLVGKGREEEREGTEDGAFGCATLPGVDGWPASTSWHSSRQDASWRDVVVMGCAALGKLGGRGGEGWSWWLD